MSGERIEGTVQAIRLGGEDFILTEGNAITTPEDYSAFRESYAHYFPDRDLVMRYRHQIGTTTDIEFGEVVEHSGPLLEGVLENVLTWGPFLP